MSNTGHRLRDFNRIHFIGVGGIGMSGLARLFLNEKKLVSGSDRAPSPITQNLAREGVSIFDTQTKENVTNDIDLVVYTEAMAKDHEEMVAARALGVPMMNYFEALGMVANEYYLIAVAGTHGKTTTTAMLIDILEDAGFDPTAIVGSLRSRTGSNFRAGKSKYMIVEACEYKRDFLSLTPDVLVITNIEHEHVDYYKNLADVQEAFRELAGQVREGGVVIMNFGGANMAPILEGLTVSIIDYGKYFDPTVKLKVPGLHNQLNAAAATAAADILGVRPLNSKEALEKFKGTWRRFEYKGELNGAKIYDDYGHHPSEIRATIEGARELYPDRRLVLVFEPHTYSRAGELFDDFVQALGQAVEAVLVPIYAAREKNERGVTSEQFVDRLNEQGSNAHYCESLSDAVSYVKNTVRENDLILVMGAGTITTVATELVS